MNWNMMKAIGCGIFSAYCIFFMGLLSVSVLPQQESTSNKWGIGIWIVVCLICAICYGYFARQSYLKAKYPWAY